MNSKAVVVGLAILVALVVVISLPGPSEQVERPVVQQPSAVPSQPPVESPAVQQPSEDPYARCVDDALIDAENCLLTGGSDCKAKGERALDDCKKLQ